MSYLIVALSYLLGSIPTAYIAGRLLRGGDIREMGDGNMGAGNSFHVLGARAGIVVFLVDAGKGVLAIVVAQAAGALQVIVLLAGVAAVVGHNWPVFLGFRGGRGEATTIGVLLSLVTLPMLILAMPALATLLIWKKVPLASTVLFLPLSLLCWWFGFSGLLISYSIALPCLVGVTHFLRTRHKLAHHAGG
jgi:glycerol-3-phosphate acyltransferase PlsY